MRAFLAARPGVLALHVLRIWATSTTQTAVSAHLVMPECHPGDAFLADIAAVLRALHAIGHGAEQIGTDAAACPLARDCVV